MFIDSIEIILSSGNGGKGAVSFRREKFVPLGGPDGGDGGKGGDVIIVCDNNAHTLANFKGKKKLSAKNGLDGDKKNKSGKSGADLKIKVPQGTQVINCETNELLCDIVGENSHAVLLKGGKGGLGNAHFKSAKNQRPNYAQAGISGQSLRVRLELKLIADVGLVGYPNAGKSSLISVLSNARPKIANYEFTTLTPKLGLVEFDEYNSFVMADIPGIIKGASKGKGLGLAFLRHIERTHFLLFVLDFTREMSLKDQLFSLQAELGSFSQELRKRAFGIVLSKSDAVNLSKEFKEKFSQEQVKLSEFLDKNNNPQKFIIALSSLEKKGLKELKTALQKQLG